MSDESNYIYSSRTTRLWSLSQVCILLLNSQCSPTDTAPTEKPNAVIPESEPMTLKANPTTNRHTDLDLDLDGDAGASATVTPQKVNKGKGKAVVLPDNRDENPTPKVSYSFIVQ